MQGHKLMKNFGVAELKYHFRYSGDQKLLERISDISARFDLDTSKAI